MMHAHCRFHLLPASVIDIGSVFCLRFGESGPCRAGGLQAQRRRYNGTLPIDTFRLQSLIDTIPRSTAKQHRLSLPALTMQAVLREFGHSVSMGVMTTLSLTRIRAEMCSKQHIVSGQA